MGKAALLAEGKPSLSLLVSRETTARIRTNFSVFHVKRGFGKQSPHSMSYLNQDSFDWGISRAVSYADLGSFLKKLAPSADSLTGAEVPPADFWV